MVWQWKAIPLKKHPFWRHRSAHCRMCCRASTRRESTRPSTRAWKHWYFSNQVCVTEWNDKSAQPPWTSLSRKGSYHPNELRSKVLRQELKAQWLLRKPKMIGHLTKSRKMWSSPRKPLSRLDWLSLAVDPEWRTWKNARGDGAPTKENLRVELSSC